MQTEWKSDKEKRADDGKKGWNHESEQEELHRPGLGGKIAADLLFTLQLKRST